MTVLGVDELSSNTVRTFIPTLAVTKTRIEWELGGYIPRGKAARA